jgi:multiple sugar transport system substrate-binding protein
MAKADKLTRRDFLRLASMAAGGALLAACQPTAAPQEQPQATPQGKEEATPAAPPPEEEVELTWLVRSSDVENPWEEDVVIPTFKEIQPNVTINMVVTVGAEWNAKAMSMYAGGTPPDVHNGIVGTFIQLYAQEMVLELGPFIDDDGFDLVPFGPLAQDPDMCRDGKQWALPILTTFGCPIFYNADMLDAAGLEYPPTDWQDKSWTWDKVLEYATKLTKDWGTGDAIYGFSGDNQFHMWAYVFGGDCWQEDWYAQGISEVPFKATDEVIDGCTFRQDLIHKHNVMPTPSDASALSQLGNMFKTGRLAIEWTGGWGYWNYDDITAFRWGIAAGPWQETNRVVNWTDCVLAAKDGVSPPMQWALIKYLTGKQGQTQYAQATSTPPTREDAIDPWLDHLAPLVVLDRDQLKQVGLGYRDNYTDNWAHFVINAREYQVIQNQEGDVMWSGEATPAEKLPDIETKMNEVGKKTYDEFKDTRLASDKLCKPLQ